MLPELPRVIRKREADITPRVLKAVSRVLSGSWAIEIKVSRTNSIPPSAVQEHQLLALKAVSHGGLTHKISDEARRRQPFDAFCVRGDAFVVACFTKNHTCYLIAPEMWKGARAEMPTGYTYRVPL